jgi:5'-phosphate synthase pdxT subunit
MHFTTEFVRQPKINSSNYLGIRVGILAFQGAFAKHKEMVESLGCSSKLVRSAEELFSCDGLIIPGGESTVISLLMNLTHFREALTLFAKSNPLFGTCAGLILMAEHFLDVTVERNAYGRQVDSFSCELPVHFPHNEKKVQAIFIRAPKITKILSPQVEVLAKHNDVPVLVKQGHFLGSSFHPELTNDPTIHQYFIEEVRHAKSGKKRSLLGHR